MKTLKDVFDYHFRNIKWDKHFAKQVSDFLIFFYSKNEAHVNFFGSNLIGVYPVRWNFSDTDTWWDEIFEVHDNIVQNDINKLSFIKSNRVVSSDVLNHAFIYALYRVHTSPDLDERTKNETKIKLMMILNCKFICSLMAHYFKYPADRGIAEKTFNKLTKRFDLKVTGSWGQMLISRSKAFVEESGRYYKAYSEYNNDLEVIKMLNDAQGRIRETVKEITKVFYQVKEENSKMLFSSSTLMLEDEKMLKDLENQTTRYIRYIKDTIAAKDGYLKPELIAIINGTIRSIDEEVFLALNHEFMDHYDDKKYSKVYNLLIEDIVLYSFEMLQESNIRTNDLALVVERLKDNFMSGRSKHPILMRMRDNFVKVVEVWDKSMKNKPMVPERCGFFLYMFLRTVLMHRYH